MKKRGLIIAAMTLPVVLLAAVLYFIEPGNGAEFIPCPIHLLTGLYCPGCGMARATHALLHLNFYQAFRYNAMSLLLIPLIGCYLTARAVDFILTGGNHVDRRLPMPLLWWLLLFLLLFGIARNIPVLPLSLLAPAKIA